MSQVDNDRKLVENNRSVDVWLPLYFFVVNATLAMTSCLTRGGTQTRDPFFCVWWWRSMLGKARGAGLVLLFGVVVSNEAYLTWPGEGRGQAGGRPRRRYQGNRYMTN